MESISKEKDLQSQIDSLKKKLDNVNDTITNPDLNSSINQSASSEIAFVKRALRRLAFGGPVELEAEKNWYQSTTKNFVFELMK